jgi:DNA-binding transcriptional regulator YdaS (Cro superfamily)
MNRLTDKQKIQIKRVWSKVNRKALAPMIGTSIRSLDQYANALEFPGARRTIIISSITGIPATSLRPDIFNAPKTKHPLLTPDKRKKG